ncbi:hypothetical protein [Dolichospermum sp. UHCC 0259]|uniref:hypothetical protein n=1 Tax=Dolichospermum sp. UHCC 0259 TaxID=2590010 RepID=UPI001447A459|nr:hypothetical protein [Dolichospermum sp. UHCC 0259]
MWGYSDAFGKRSYRRHFDCWQHLSRFAAFIQRNGTFVESCINLNAQVRMVRHPASI